MEKSERFGMVLSPALKVTGSRRAKDEGLSLAAYVRRLILADAKRYGLWPSDAHVDCRPQPDTEQGREEHRG